MEQAYHDKIIEWLMKQEDGKILNVSDAENPPKFVEAIKRIIDLKAPQFYGFDLTFSNDYKRLKIVFSRQEVDAANFNKLSETF